MKRICNICRHEAEHLEFSVAEKMLGLGDRFLYFCCRQCGCLQLAQAPPDWSRYYPQDYYSLTQKPIPQHGLKSWLAGRRDRDLLTGRRGLGSWLAREWPNNRLDVASLGRLPVQPDQRILDVGCGSGQLLTILYRAGFRHLMGLDPYLIEDLEVLPGLWLRRQSIEKIQGSYDVIMMHHVLEHLSEPLTALAVCSRCLKPEGKILLRLPTVESEAWEQYRENWVQLDAPRHQYLHTRASLERLARQSGLTFEAYWCDSTGFQFWGSDLYRRGLKLQNPEGSPRDLRQHFSAEELAAYEARSRELNAVNRGDQVVAILSRTAA